MSEARILWQSGRSQVWCGDWREVLPLLERCEDGAVCDHSFNDPPYSRKTHKGATQLGRTDGSKPTKIAYEPWGTMEAYGLGKDLSTLARGWICIMADHILAPYYLDAMEDAGRYIFPPVPLISPNLRACGGGPSSDAVYLCVSRPARKPWSDWTATPGHYDYQRVRGSKIAGVKPPDLLRRIVGDYSNRGDLILDCCAGEGSTGIACMEMGREFILIERDPTTARILVERIERAVKDADAQPELFGAARRGQGRLDLQDPCKPCAVRVDDGGGKVEDDDHE